MARRANTSPKAVARRVKTAEDTAEAIRLRTSGVGVREIARRLERSTGWVSENVNGAIREIPTEEAALYREHVVAREESIIEAHWEKRGEPESAKVIQASDRLLVDVLGLAAPKRTEHTGHRGGPIAVVDYKDLANLTDEQLDQARSAVERGAEPNARPAADAADRPGEGTPPAPPGSKLPT